MPAAERTLQIAGSNVIILPDAEAASRAAADRIAEVVASALGRRGKAVLGLATGATPEAVYADLAARHRAGALSFQNVVTYNLDEYYPIQPTDPLSYRSYMNRHLFDHVDIPPNRAHVLDKAAELPLRGLRDAQRFGLGWLEQCKATPENTAETSVPVARTLAAVLRNRVLALISLLREAPDQYMALRPASGPVAPVSFRPSCR